MLGRLIVLCGPDQGLVFVIPEGAPFLIGRSNATATQLSDPRVSRSHCRIDFDRGALRLVDVGSKRGTYVNGQRVAEHQLRQGDIIRIGDTALRFQGEPLDIGSGREPDALPPLPKGVSAGPGSEPVADQPISLNDLVGKSLAHFSIQRPLATTATGVVFQANDLNQDRTVALKVLWPEACRDEQESRRFLDLMRPVIPIEHPNVIRLYETDKSGLFCWLSMEFVEGETLADAIRRNDAVEKFDWRRVCRIAVQLARALRAIDHRGLTHGCATPSNVYLRTSDRAVKLGNLMFAKAIGFAFRTAKLGDVLASRATARGGADGVTQTGELLADLPYLPPEHTDQAGETDIRGDLYSVGATLYALLTGQPPCDGESLTDVIEKIRYVTPEDPRQLRADVPEPLAHLVLKTLEKRRADRHQTPDELLADLARIGECLGEGRPEDG